MRLAMPMGSYLLIVRQQGFRDTRCPVRIGRNQQVHVNLRLFTDAEIGEGFVYVPAGPLAVGGDPAVPRQLERRMIDVSDFFMARFPVTNGEYLPFINDVAARNPGDARKRVPRWEDFGGSHWLEDDCSRWSLPKGKDQHGLIWEPDQPVVDVTWFDANAYAAWRSTVDGRRYRLPTEVEWEKAARGADGRYYPWGDRFDATWCNMSESRLEGGPRLGPVGEFAVDESP
ncbi:MAG: SUMF1/EgtB/PvdO family nonheme iron enzyme [Candidatus Schekmanbacteria bacterium]|nr:SUMF1/EgtB/PvdO family nonheme iron enzyme [Candidatus Schekmanbacteria bacterium]